MPYEAWNTVATYLAEAKQGAVTTFSMIDPQARKGKPTPQDELKVHIALLHIGSMMFQPENILAVRTGRGVHRVPEYPRKGISTLCYWTSDDHLDLYKYEMQDTAVNLKDLSLSNKARFVQFIHGERPVDAVDPEAVSYTH